MKSALVLTLALCPILFSEECFPQTREAVKATASDAGPESGAYRLDKFSMKSAVEHAEKLEERLFRQEELNKPEYEPNVRNALPLHVKANIGLHQDVFEKSGQLKPLSGRIPDIRIKKGMVAIG